MNRRTFVRGFALAALARPALRAQEGRKQVAVTSQVKALVFDTFGTVVDWRGQ